MSAQNPTDNAITRARKRIAWLNQTIERHNYLYYQRHTSEISDYEYDRLMQELMDLEARFPSLRSPTSASLRVGGSIQKDFPSAAHKVRMLSLDNTYEMDEIELFIGRVKKNTDTEAAISYVCEPKLDGVAISLHYKKGILTEAITRGDGGMGEVVTENVQTIRSLPLQVKGKAVPVHFELRGEVVMSGATFEDLNAERKVKAFSLSDALRQVENKLKTALLDALNETSEVNGVDKRTGVAQDVMDECYQAIATAQRATEAAREALDEELKKTSHTLKKAEEVLGSIDEVSGSFKQLEVFEKVLEDIGKESERARKEAAHTYANPRNTVAGSIKMQKSAQVAKRKLDAYLYALIVHEAGDGDTEPMQTHSGQLAWLKAHQFKTTEAHRECRNIQEISAYISDWDAQRASFPVETDGVVIKVNDIAQRVVLGETAKSPSWAIAYKYAPAQVFTQLRKVVYQVGRTGVITPVAEVDPVLVEGTTVRRASLHNQDEIERLGLCYEDYVAIEKSGHIIPKVMQIDSKRRKEGAAQVVAPVVCPSCQTNLVRSEDKVALMCPNTNLCPDQQLGRLEHFVSRAALDIEALGKETLKAFFKKKLIQDAGDLYALTEDMLLALEIAIETSDTPSHPSNESVRTRTLGEKSVRNILVGIEKSKQKAFAAVLFGLGIPHVGRTTADTLAEHLGSMEAITRATIDELCEIPDIGPTTAEQIHTFLQQDEQKKLIEKLRAAGLPLAEDASARKARKDTLKGKRLVVSGRFVRQSRDELKSMIVQHGGLCASSVSKQVDYLVVGEEPGARKLQKAAEYGTKIMSEDDLLKLLKEAA